MDATSFSDEDAPRTAPAEPSDSPEQNEEGSAPGRRRSRYYRRPPKKAGSKEQVPAAEAGGDGGETREAAPAAEQRDEPAALERRPQRAASEEPSRDDRDGHSDGPSPAPEQREARENRERDPRDRGGQHHAHPGDRFQGGGHRDHFHKKGKKHKKKGKPRFREGGGGGGWSQPAPPAGPVISGDLPQPGRFADREALDRLAGEVAGGGDPIYLDDLSRMTLAELTEFARREEAAFDGSPNPRQLMAAILQMASERKRPLIDRGHLDLTDRGYGFIVYGHENYQYRPESTYVPESLIRRYGLKRGHELEVQAQAPQPNERCPAALRVAQAMDMDPEEVSKVKPFEELIPYYPLNRMLLEVPDKEGSNKDVSMRAVDILTPIGFGQRGLIVAPPRTGKTVLLQNIANSVAKNNPQSRLIVLLIDERPEEVTDFRRHVEGEVVSSTFDETPESHVHAAEMVSEKARRLVEKGEHVVILLDSITRLARAYNALASNSGKIMSGGMEATALQRPKRFFGGARNIEGAGSLTIMATALIDTGSRMDEVIFEEFKGTGNMELHLDRGLVDKRIFPAINMDKSGTRKEELIYHPDEMARIYALRRAMQGVPPLEAMEMLIGRLKKTKTNAEFLMGLNR